MSLAVSRACSAAAGTSVCAARSSPWPATRRSRACPGTVRRDAASRPVVGRDPAGRPSARRLRRVRHAAGIRGGVLRMGTVPVALLLSADRPAASLVALLARPPDPRRAPGLPRHLLLLPQGLLPRLLSRSAGLRRRRNAQPGISRRDGLSLHPPEPPPLLP